jgi:tetratricopeptide (TPR) repeat protein
MMHKVILYGLLLISLVCKAQEKDTYLPKGNEDFAAKNYSDAEANYRLSQAKFKKKAISSYNLGTSIYKQDQTSEAKYQFEKAIKEAKTKAEKHQAYHNLGNVLMKEKEYSKAVDAYKDALRNDPTDEETRYNYALAKKMLKDNPPPPPSHKDKKDPNKDNQKNQDNKGQNPNNQDKGNGQQPLPQQPSGASKERIKSLLDAINNEEKKVQEKVNAQKAQGNPQKPEKDW